MVTPILVYGAELWGYERVEIIERVQTKFCKHLLRVGNQTSNLAVLGECGRTPLYVEYITKCIKYWLKNHHYG